MRVACVIVWAFCVGCGAPADDGGVSELEPAALASDHWRWDYVTAALGGDRKHWLSFEGDGVVVATTQTWVVDGERNDWAVAAQAGTYTVGPDHLVTLQVGERMEHFTAAVVDDAPAHTYVEGVRTFAGKGRALATRAFVRQAEARWRTRYGEHTQDADEEQTTVTVELDLEASTCTIAYVVNVTLRAADGTTETADERFAGIPCGFESYGRWRVVVAEGLLSVEGRGDVLKKNDVWNRLGSPMAYRLMDTLRPVLFVDPDAPALLLPSFNDWEEDAWWRAAEAPPSPGDAN